MVIEIVLDSSSDAVPIYLVQLVITIALAVQLQLAGIILYLDVPRKDVTQTLLFHQSPIAITP